MPAEHAARRLGMAGGAKSAKTDYAAGKRDRDGKRTHVPTVSLRRPPLHADDGVGLGRQRVRQGYGSCHLPVVFCTLRAAGAAGGRRRRGRACRCGDGVRRWRRRCERAWSRPLMVSPRSGDVAMMASASATDFVELRTQSVCHALIFIKLAHSKAAGSRAPITKDSALTSAGTHARSYAVLRSALLRLTEYARRVK